MNDKQKRFASEYVVDLNATKAAERAGYAQRTAYSQGHRLLRNAEVQARISELQAERSERTEVTADRVVQELATVAFLNVGDFLTVEHGVVSVDLSKINPEAMRAVKKIRQREVLVGDADTGGVVQVCDFETHDKIRALDMLMRHLGAYAADKHELSGTAGPIEYLALLRAADKELEDWDKTHGVDYGIRDDAAQ